MNRQLKRNIALVALVPALILFVALVPWGSIFVPGEEPFTALLRDPNHLAFEAITGIAQTAVVDLFVLAFAWPLIKRHIHRDIDRSHGDPVCSIEDDE